MSNVFNIKAIADQIQAAQQRAKALAGAFADDVFSGHVLPPVPFPDRGRPQPITGADGYDEAGAVTMGTSEAPSYTIFGTPMCFPLSVKLTNSSEDWWLLPTEPLITIGGGNILTRRNVAKSKMRGSIKERWSTDDYTINIDGLFTKVDDWTYPQEDVSRLRRMMEARDTVDVKCQLFEIFGIGRIAIEKCDWPFTKGEENQAYRISAFSDDDWDLLIKK